MAVDWDLEAEPAVVGLLARHGFADGDKYHAAYELGIRAYWAGREAAATDIELWWWGSNDEKARVASVARGGHGRDVAPVPWAPRSHALKPVAPVIVPEVSIGGWAPESGPEALRRSHTRTASHRSRRAVRRRRHPASTRRRSPATGRVRLRSGQR